MENKESNKKKLEKDGKNSTHIGEGMLFGVAIGSAIWALVGLFSSIVYMPIGTSIGIMIGMAIGSGIEKKS